MKDNDFEQTKKEAEGTPYKEIRTRDNADDITLLANAPAQAETLITSLERAPQA